MAVWFSSVRWLKWLILLVSAAGFAIALAHVLNRPTLNTLTPSTAIASGGVASAPLQFQARYDRQLVHYATVSRTDGSFRQMFIEEPTIAAVQSDKPLPDGALIVMETWYSPTHVGLCLSNKSKMVNGNMAPSILSSLTIR